MVEAAQKVASLMDLTVALAPRTRIEEVRLANSTVRSQDSRMARPWKVDCTFTARTDIDQEAKKLVVHAFLTAFAKAGAESDTADEPMRIEAEFILVYAVDSLDGIEREQAAAFGRMNGIHNVWPYWREYVQSTTVRLGLPPLVLAPVTGESLLKYYSAKSSASEEATVEIAKD